MIRNHISSTYRRTAKSYNDAPTEVDMVQSVKEVRRIYSDLSDEEFVRMYARKYRFREHDVADFLQQIQTQESADQ